MKKIKAVLENGEVVEVLRGVDIVKRLVQKDDGSYEPKDLKVIRYEFPEEGVGVVLFGALLD